MEDCPECRTEMDDTETVCPKCGHDRSTAAAPALPSQYEFSPEQNKLIADLAAMMRGVGQMTMLLGVIMLLGALTTMLLNGLDHLRTVGIGFVIPGLIFFFLGNWTINAAVAFHVIVDTKGSNIQLLMDALANLRKVYTLIFWLVVIGLLALVVCAGVVFTLKSLRGA